jgi:NhaA family Na+:H+ antiporter
MSSNPAAPASVPLLLERPIDFARDHIRGGSAPEGVVNLVLYGDYFCHYCRRGRGVLDRVRQTMGERLRYVYRHFPNERVHPGTEFLARAAEAVANQGQYWQMHDWIYSQEPPIAEAAVLDFVRSLGIDMARFHRDLNAEVTHKRVEEDLADARRNGVAATPTAFVDGLRYDGAWDFDSLMVALERPGARGVQRSARVFASLPAGGGLVLLLAAALALICANSPLAPYYRRLMDFPFGFGSPNGMLALSIGEWLSEGLLGIFLLLLGLEIRREIAGGMLADKRALTLPAIAALGGVLAPAAIYLAMNPDSAARGWAVPTATDIAFTLGILALMGERIPLGLRVFVAALAVFDDALSVLNLAVFYLPGFEALWLFAGGPASVALYLLNRSRVYAIWPYAVVSVGLGLSFHEAGVHAALAGLIMAAFLPSRPAPAVGALLGQVANALTALEDAEKEAKSAGDARRIEKEPIWDWVSENLSAASDRLLSPADRIARAVAPWTTYLILPLFAFSAMGVSLDADFSSPDAMPIVLGVVMGLVLGKPLGIALASFFAIQARIGIAPDDVTLRQFIGAACLCGVGDTLALLLADQAFPEGPEAGVAKIGILTGSLLAAALGALILASHRTRGVSAVPAG